MATTLYNAVHYWLVDHPFIAHYEWDAAQSPGASLSFLSATVVTYLSSTLLLHRFPSILPKLPAAAIRLAAAAHNVVLCLLSLAMAVGCTLAVLHETPPGNPSWGICFPAGATTARGPTFFWAHVFYLSKILEFVDTLLILLSASRSRRLSFLHVYHHAGVVVMCYMWLAAAPTFPVGLVTNAAVHVVMYAYYFMAALGFRPRWKRAVTDCQITQFLFGYFATGVMLYFHFTGPGCSGVWVWGLSMVFTTSLLGLFVNFHLMNYTRDEGKKE